MERFISTPNILSAIHIQKQTLVSELKGVGMRTLFIFLSVIALVGCATTYQKQGATGGYSSTQLDTNVFQVSFKGNGFTSRERANDFALLRSAELALENGFKYFVIIDAQQYSQNSTYTTPVTSTTNINTNTYGTAYGYGNYGTYSGNTYGTATTTTYGGQAYHISKPRAANTIVCFKDKPEGFSYNARFIEKSLKGKYELYEPNKSDKPNESATQYRWE